MDYWIGKKTKREIKSNKICYNDYNSSLGLQELLPLSMNERSDIVSALIVLRRRGEIVSSKR